MDCPVCSNVKLVMSDRQGIEIDYCPNCRGVWLDRGELDKIIERTIGMSAPPAPAGMQVPAPQQHQPHQPQQHQQHYPQQHQQHYPQQQGYYKKKKKEGFLGELFDFD